MDLLMVGEASISPLRHGEAAGTDRGFDPSGAKIAKDTKRGARSTSPDGMATGGTVVRRGCALVP